LGIAVVLLINLYRNNEIEALSAFGRNQNDILADESTEVVKLK
jgi:hypothetical protein